MKVKKLTKKIIISPLKSIQYQIMHELFFMEEELNVSDVEILALLASYKKPVLLKDFCEDSCKLLGYSSAQSVRNRIQFLEASGFIKKTNDPRNKQIVFSTKLSINIEKPLLIDYSLLVHAKS